MINTILKKRANSCLFKRIFLSIFAEGPTSHVGLVVDNYPYFHKIFILYTCTVYTTIIIERRQERKTCIGQIDNAQKTLLSIHATSGSVDLPHEEKLTSTSS